MIKKIRIVFAEKLETFNNWEIWKLQVVNIFESLKFKVVDQKSSPEKKFFYDFKRWNNISRVSWNKKYYFLLNKF